MPVKNAAPPEKMTGEEAGLFAARELPATIEDAGDQNFVALDKE